MRRVLTTTVLLLFALVAGGFRKVPGVNAQQPYSEKQAAILGLMRTIITFEYSDFSQDGSYETWPALLERHADDFNGWLAQNWPRQADGQGTAQRFSALPEVLPGWKLRLELSADGHRYSVLIEDVNDKQGLAYFGDERGIIRQGKYIN